MWTDRSSTPSRPRVMAMLVLVALAAAFLGGATESWAWGVVSVLVGLAFLGVPPRHRLPIVVYVPVALLLLLPLLAFLPAGWFASPAWRVAVTRDLGIALPGTVTPQPWLTLESWLLLALGVSWLVYATSLLTTNRSRWNLARAYVTGAGLLTMLALLCALLKQPLPFWHAWQGFGFFPNRNQMGDWLALAGLLLPALIYEDWKHNRLLTIWWVFVMCMICVALVINYSRAGVLIFLGGVAVFSLLMSLVRRWLGRCIIGVTIGMFLITLFLLFGGATRDRFHLGAASAPKEIHYSRLDIQKDALDMKRATPWTGIGLGNFNSVFPFYRERSRNENRVLHPESDWVWLTTEAGWGAALAVAAGVAAIVAMIFPLERGTARTLRLAAAVGVVAFAVHGLVDVSAHRPGTFFPACLFALLVIHPRYYEPVGSGVRVSFRWLGLVWMALGAYFLTASFAPGLWPGTVGIQRAKKLADVVPANGDSTATVQVLDRALRWAPLDWELYYRRAAAQLRSAPDQARQDFLRARMLEPTSSLIPKHEGLLWLPIAPFYSLTAWSEALRRDRHNPVDLYSQLLQAGGGVPMVRDGLRRLAMDKPELFLVFANNISKEEFHEMLGQLLDRDPQLNSFDLTRRQQLFKLWSDKEGLESLVAAVAQHPTWKPVASVYVARDLASRGDYSRAYTLRRSNLTPPVYPRIESNTSMEALQARFLQRPDDFASSYILVRQLLLANRKVEALDKIHAVSQQKNCPAYFYFLGAETAASLERWHEAWDALDDYESRAQH